jgi:DNA-binding transcriptional regulator GbsR (MarR family)
LLYITGKDLCTDDIMERLQISRGNASMSTRALVDWGIVSRVNRRGDRKEYFQAEQDVWAMFRAIVRERMNREVDPLLASLHEIRDMTGAETSGGKPPPELREQIAGQKERIDAMLEFFVTLEKLGARFVSPSGKGLQLAASLLSKMPDFGASRDESPRERSAR